MTRLAGRGWGVAGAGSFGDEEVKGRSGIRTHDCLRKRICNPPDPLDGDGGKPLPGQPVTSHTPPASPAHCPACCPDVQPTHEDVRRLAERWPRLDRATRRLILTAAGLPATTSEEEHHDEHHGFTGPAESRDLDRSARGGCPRCGRGAAAGHGQPNPRRLADAVVRPRHGQRGPRQGVVEVGAGRRRVGCRVDGRVGQAGVGPRPGRGDLRRAGRRAAAVSRCPRGGSSGGYPSPAAALAGQGCFSRDADNTQRAATSGPR